MKYKKSKNISAVSQENARTIQYIGPPYGSAVVLPGAGECDPLNMTEKQIKNMIKNYPEVSRYFEVKE